MRSIEDTATGRDEFDTPAEVDAVFRTQRRIAVAHLIVLVGGMLVIPVTTLATGWWSGDGPSGSPLLFVVAGAGLYVFFFALGLGAASLADGVERRMLGAPDDDGDQ